MKDSDNKDKKDQKNKKQKPPSEAARGGQGGHKANWREVYASVDDIKAFLDDNALLRYNTVTGRIGARRGAGRIGTGGAADEMRSMRQQMTHTDTDDTDVF